MPYRASRAGDGRTPGLNVQLAARARYGMALKRNDAGQSFRREIEGLLRGPDFIAVCKRPQAEGGLAVHAELCFWGNEQHPQLPPRGVGVGAGTHHNAGRYTEGVFLDRKILPLRS